jgi:hypothetical protein
MARSTLDSFEAAWLRGVFMRALRAAVTSSLVAAGCSSGETSPCPDGKRLNLAELKPAAPFDFAAVRVSGDFAGPTPIPDYTRTGEPCSGATDSAACLAALTEGPQTSEVEVDPGLGCGMSGCNYLVTTSGDEVERYTSHDDLLAFLGPIDAPEDARLLLLADYAVECSSTRVERNRGGFRVTTLRTTNSCPVEFSRVTVQVSTAGEIDELASRAVPSDGNGPCPGRRPEGLVITHQPSALTKLGDHFAAISELEAASVTAFEVLANELEHHCAPTSIIAATYAAARDEVRHAHATARIAERFGATPATPIILAQPVRSLEAIALDNATEGCVRETFGALLGHYQAANARDPEVAALMREIAQDETHHAALSYQLDAWIMPRLDPPARARVEAARHAAVSELTKAGSVQPSRQLRELAGIPDATASATLIASVASELWPSDSTAVSS